MTLQSRIFSIFRGFFQSLLSSPSVEVQTAARISARDVRTNLGSNIKLVESITGSSLWTSSKGHLMEALREMERQEVPDVDHWRVGLLTKLLQQRLTAYYGADDENVKRLQDMIDSLVIN